MGSRWPKRTVAERFWSHVDMSAGDGDVCWPWIGPVNKYGYPHFRVDHNGTGVVRANRLAVTLVEGPAPDDKPYALHHCDNRRCCHVHPNHVQWGTQKENCDEVYARYRRAPKDIRLHGVQQDLV
ncbi:MAG TPA: hypothetical protein VEU74_11920 [Gemmatimonadales bacterium]|nr:hypothetical protein [Gemmatimonadales bacterium]